MSARLVYCFSVIYRFRNFFCNHLKRFEIQITSKVSQQRWFTLFLFIQTSCGLDSDGPKLISLTIIIIAHFCPILLGVPLLCFLYAWTSSTPTRSSAKALRFSCRTGDRENSWQLKFLPLSQKYLKGLPQTSSNHCTPFYVGTYDLLVS